MKLVTTEQLSDVDIQHGEVVYACAVSGANVLRDVREAIVNTFGGRMKRYERLLDETIERALAELARKASDKGYDGVVAVRISHPVITEGAIEVVVSGTGYTRRNPDNSPSR